jgi:hypothetical protein
MGTWHSGERRAGEQHRGQVSDPATHISRSHPAIAGMAYFAPGPFRPSLREQQMKQRLLASLVLGVASVAFADSKPVDPKLAGTYLTGAKEIPGRADPLGKIVITLDGGIVVREYSIRDRVMTTFGCPPATDCKLRNATLSTDKGDIVVSVDVGNGPQPFRRYHISADGKTLTMSMAGGGKMWDGDLKRAD